MGGRNKTVVFTGGGTAGHVLPAFSVIDRLRLAGYKVFWIGSNRGIEKKLVEQADICYFGVPSGKFRRYASLKNITDLFRILAGFVVARRILRRERPTLMFSKGGFVSVPPVAAARSLGVLTFTHESDVSPGLATRLNTRLGARVLLSYERTRDYLRKGIGRSAIVVGNPIRDSILAGRAAQGREIAGLKGHDKQALVLVLGGSSGSRELNTLIEDVLDSIVSKAVVVHQRGWGNAGRPDTPGYISRPFFDEDLPHLLAAADLAVSRSGAGAVWELAATRTPAIFIPLRKGSRGDQALNARMADEAGMSVTLAEDADSEDLECLISELLSDASRLGKMAAAAAVYRTHRAADSIFELLKEYL